MFRVDADDVELIGCTVIPNTFLVWRRSENEKIYNTTTRLSLCDIVALRPGYGR